MLNQLNRPLWPNSRFNLTTPLSLLLTAVSVVTGVILYRRGYTYEGAVLVYMIGTILFTFPYYAAQYTRYMTIFLLMCFVPMAIWLQNKSVEVGGWHYRPPDGYLLWFTKEGEGWWHWTRHFWLGNDMPVMEYLFYPLFCLFQIMLYSLYAHLLPRRWFEQPHRALRWLFPIVTVPVIGMFVAIYFMYPNPVTNYLYWQAGFGYILTVIGFCTSSSYRTYTRTPAFWMWVVGMSAMFLPVWEWFHCLLNHDWIYNSQNNFPYYLKYKGDGVPVNELLGYLTCATTFKALMLLMIRRFGHIVVKDRRCVPFGRGQFHNQKLA